MSVGTKPGGEEIAHLNLVADANRIKFRTSHLARRIMSRVGIDPELSTSEEVPLADGTVIGSTHHSGSKRISKVERTKPITIEAGQDGNAGTQHLRLVQETTQYRIKRSFVPSLVGDLAFRMSSFSSFYIERAATEPQDADMPEQTEPFLGEGLRFYAGRIGVEAPDSNVRTGIDEARGFAWRLQVMARAIALDPDPLPSPVR